MNVRNRTESLSYLIGPMLLVGGVSLGFVPLLHPNNTCHDWLQKWGQLSSDPLWLPVHQLAMLGFTVAAVGAAFLPLLNLPSFLNVAAGGLLGSGLGIQALLVLFHATAVSTLGRAYNSADTESARQLVRTTAEAFVSYDVATSAVAAILISAGATLFVAELYRERVLSMPLALFLGGLGLVWVFQAHGLFRLLRVPTSEWIPYGSLACWLAAVATLLLLHQRARPAVTANENRPVPAEV